MLGDEKPFFVEQLQEPHERDRKELKKKDKGKMKKKAKESLEDAATFFGLSLPICTTMGFLLIAEGIGGLVSRPKESSIMSTIRSLMGILGIPLVIGGIIIDTVKAPITLTLSAVMLAKSGVYKAISLTEKSPDKEQMDEIMESFKLRFCATANLLVLMELETVETLNKKIQLKNKEFISLCALTWLNTAFASRMIPDDAILFANGKILTRQECPSQGLEIFNYILQIKNLLVNIGLNQMDNIEASSIIREYVPIIKEALEHPTNELEEKVNKMNPYVKEIITALYNIGEKTNSQKQLQKNVSDIKKRTNKSSQITTKILKSKCVLTDKKTGKLLGTHVVVGYDGFLYNAEEKSIFFTKYYGSTDAKDSCIIIDPITGDKLVNPVIANDGRLYSKLTVARMISSKNRGLTGIVLTGFVECDPLKWPYKIV